MSQNPLFFAAPRTEPYLFVPGYSTRPRIIFRPGASGSQVYGVNISNGHSGSETIEFGIARLLTSQANMGVGHFVDGGGGSDTMTRTAGSFITDGWKAGERLFTEGSTTLANDFTALLSAVSGTTLTYPTGTDAADEDMAAGMGVYRLALLSYVSAAAGAGKPSVVAVSGLDIVQIPFLDDTPDRHFELGPNDLLVAMLGTALTSTETLDICTFARDY